MRFFDPPFSHIDPAAELAAISPHLHLRTSKRARRVALRLDSKSRSIHLVVPPRYSQKRAVAFAQEHKEWIQQKIAELPQPVPFKDGTIIPVLGRDRTCLICYDKTLRSTSISLNQNELIVATNQNDPSLRLIRYLKKTLKEEITRLAEEKAAQSGQTIKSIQIRDTKSRWGSCGPDKNLNFSWRIIFAPYAALDYLAAHEVAHLTHMNHGPEFWALCEELSDNYKHGKSWLREHGHTLLRYGA